MNIDVQTTFTDIVDSGIMSNQHTYNLASYFNENPKKFLQQMEGCYLKIIKNFTALSKQQRRLFELCTERLFTHLLADKKQQPPKDGVIQLVRHFLRFFAEGLESSQFLIRICCGRHLFMLLRAIQPSQLDTIVEEKLSLELLQNTMALFRSGRGQKNSKTERGLAVKLGAYLQHLKWDDDKPGKLKQGCCMLRSEMVRTLCEEERKDLRLDALTNLELNATTLQYVIIRVRDVDVGVRLQVLKKLMKSAMMFNELELCDLYQLLHDGLRNSSVDVRKQCQGMLMEQVYALKKKIEGEVQHDQEGMQEEDGDKKRTSNMRRRVSVGGHAVELQVIRRTLQSFMSMLKVEHTLILPAIYDVLVDVVKTIITSYREPSEIALYVKDLFQHRMMVNTTSVLAEEVFFARVAVKTQDLDASICSVIDTHFLDGIQLADYLESCARDGQSLLLIYEVIQMASCLINCDETGRHRLQSTLKRLILNPRIMLSPRSTTTHTRHNEVYEGLNEYEIESRWFGLHHFETPIIRDYFDLILPAVKVLNKLHPNEPQTFAQEIANMINTIRNPVVGLSEDIEEGNLTQHRRSIELKLKIQEEQREDQLVRLREARNLKKKQQQSLLECQHNETIQYIQTLEQALSKVDKQIAEIDSHALFLIDALFNQVERGVTQDAPITKLSALVLDLNKHYYELGNFRVPQQMGLKCLSYVPLFDQGRCQNILTIFINILSKSIEVAGVDVLNGEDPILIISLRSILDCLLLYNFDDNTDFGSDPTKNMDKNAITNIVANLAIKSRGTLQCTALEGLAKLLLHQKLTNALVYVALFLFLWFDRSIKEQHLQLQIVTTFFKCFITSSVDLLKLFEKGLEVYTCVCCFINSKPDLRLNPSYLSSGHWQEVNILRNTSIGIKMLHYKTIAGHTSHLQLKERLLQCNQQGSQFYLGPQEHFIIFICKMVKELKNYVLRSLLNEKEFDFIANYDINGEQEQKIQIEPGLFEILCRYLKSTVEALDGKGKTTTNEQALLKAVYEGLGTEVLSDKTLESVKVIDEEFSCLKQHINYLVELMQRDKIIIEDPRNTRDRDLGELPARHRTYSDASEEGDQSESPRKRQKQKSEDEVQPPSDDSEPQPVVPTQGRKRAIQKKKVNKNK